MFNLKNSLVFILVAGIVVFLTVSAWAHFQELIPSPYIVTAESGKTVSLDIVFTHPMEGGPVMEMGKPVQFGVLAGGVKTNLLDTLQPKMVDGKTAYSAEYSVKMPGDYIFYIEPAPYWEPAEGKMIIHYTKVVVDAYGDETGWDAMVGFPVEIEPLVRPYGLWAGNLFRGVVMKDGMPVPYAEVEVEYLNEGGAVEVPEDVFITQVIKADGQGMFSYAMPRAGWWGFAALVDGAPMKNPDGEMVDVEQGALMCGQVRGDEVGLHISDGVLSGPVLATTAGLAVAGVAAGLYKLDYEKVPRVGVLAATFFVASLIHVPIGPTSAHLILNGLMGLLLGWAVFPSLALALLLQAILFGFGGITSLGANVVDMGVPAIICYYLFAGGIKPGASPGKIFTLGFAAGSIAVMLSGVFTASVLYFSGKEFVGAASAILLAHIPVIIIEGFVTGSAVVFLYRVRPEIFQLPRHSGRLGKEGIHNA